MNYLLFDLKQRLGDQAESVADDELRAALTDSIEMLKAHRIDHEQRSDLMFRLAVVFINRRGSEGVASESYEGISQSNINGLPDELRRDIIQARSVIW